MSMWRRPVTAEESSAILRLHHVEGWPVGTIGAELGRHHDTVERVLSDAGLGVHKQAMRPRLDQNRRLGPPSSWCCSLRPEPPGQALELRWGAFEKKVLGGKSVFEFANTYR